MRWLFVLLILLFMALPTGIAAADDTVTVVAVPYVGGGVVDFTATYITDTQVDLEWTRGADIANVMVRAKYGSMPEDRTDGYFVYYGALEAFTDTSMNFDENAGIIYYRAWAQNNAGIWNDSEVTTSNVEGIIMTLIGIILLAGILSYFALKNEFMLWKFVAAIGWIAVFMYIKDNPPGNLTEGEPAHVALMLVAVTAGLAVAVLSIGRSISTSRPVGYGSNGGGLNLSEWKWKFGKDKQEFDRIDQTFNRLESNAQIYRERVRRALGRE